MAKSTREEIIRAALEPLRKSGRLTPQAVVRAARDKRHPLHKEFEWNDAKAADMQRIERARELIRYVTVVVVNKTASVVSPYYVRDPRAPPKEAGYVPVTAQEIDRNNAKTIMLAELDRCESAVERARNVVGALDKKFPGISDQFENLLRKVLEIREMLRAA